MLKGGFEAMPLQQMPLLVVAVVLSPVLGVASLIAAMSKLEISKVVTIRTLEPFIVVAYALVFFSTLPSLQELAGGSLIVAGVATMTLFHKLRNGRKVAASEG
jgi:drug/metabolite transporter (DMT)-like permease